MGNTHIYAWRPCDKSVSAGMRSTRQSKAFRSAEHLSDPEGTPGGLDGCLLHLDEDLKYTAAQQVIHPPIAYPPLPSTSLALGL